MRKITLFIFTVMATTMFAGGGWANCAVSITKDAATPYQYALNNENWTDGTWLENTAFNGYDFGTPTSLILNGAAGNGWTDDSPGYDATSFVLYYRIYKSDATPGSWTQLSLDNQAYKSGNNYIYDKSDANIDVLALATLSGTNTYTFEVVMSKNQFYFGGNWNSMIPGGQGIAYSDASAGYKATFTKTNTATKIDNNEIRNLRIHTQNMLIKVDFEGEANVVFYNASGKILANQITENHFEQLVIPGMYLLNINGKTHKILLK